MKDALGSRDAARRQRERGGCGEDGGEIFRWGHARSFATPAQTRQAAKGLRPAPVKALDSSRTSGTLARVTHLAASALNTLLPGAFVAVSLLQKIFFGWLGLGVLFIVVCVWGYRRRRRHLIEMYGDPDIAKRIMKCILWKGETQEQLVESLGRPSDIDQKVLKTKTKEVWKYRPTARNRFGLKVTLDDGIVAGWEQND